MKQTLSILTAVFAVLAFLVSCGGSEGSKEPGSIYGIVTDKATGELITNAGVELGSFKTVTGSDGQFEFNDISAGSYTLHVTKSGYAETSSVVTIKSGETMRKDVQLEKAQGALRIVNDAGKDISELNFGAEIADVSRQFNIFNDGTERLEWELSFSADWIKSVSKESGELNAGVTQGVIVNIDRSLLREGENITTIHITSNDGNKQLKVKATNSECKEEGHFYDGSKCVNPCEKNLCGERGTCEPTGATTYECDCDNGYFSDGSKCVNPCEKNLCGEHGTCEPTGATTYECDCDDDYFWNGSKDSECVNPCEKHSCGNGFCTATDADTYRCNCEDGLFWNGRDCDIFPPCLQACTAVCKDPATTYKWSPRSKNNMGWNEAKDYCENLTEGEYSDWTLPEKDVLKTAYYWLNYCFEDSCFWSSSYKLYSDGDESYYYLSSSGTLKITSDSSKLCAVRCFRY
ncbi:carboxypeptidase regulatory-like domain-containing protein [bacterium]|nr:carboxypeptidase regulatory-like domain-containing protein [bacterium]